MTEAAGVPDTMTHLECPMCDTPVPVEDDAPGLACPTCSIVVEFAGDPVVDLVSLAA